MIFKEKTSTAESQNKYVAAGQKAEQAMAFYLKREFKDDPDIFVFNDMEMLHNGEKAQMDHLVLCKYGFFIIESKSITGTVHINKSLEWSRKDYSHGIPSPILQARRQGKILLSALDANKERLRGKTLFGLIQKSFHRDRCKVLVAIADQGIIEPDSIRDQIPEVHKADAIPEVIRQEIKKVFVWRDDDNSTGKLLPFPPDELQQICDFLLLQDKRARGQGLSEGLTYAEIEAAFSKKPETKKEIIADKPQRPDIIPLCHKCGKEMVLRTSSKGEKKGEQFYGCSAYPKCWGKRDAKTLQPI